MKLVLKDKKVTMVDNDRIVIVEENIDNCKSDRYGKKYLVLPENSVNRKYTQLDKLIKLGTIDYGNEIKETRTLTRTNTHDRPSKTSTSWVEYLTEEEKKTFETLIEKATKRMNDPIEILLRQKRELERKIAELQSKGTN